MQIAKDKVASIDYKLTDKSGSVLDSSEGRDPLYYLHGNGNLIAGLEEALEGKGSGDSIQVSVPPEKGYGLRNDALVQNVEKSMFQGVDKIESGMQFQAQTEAGVQIFTVVSVEGEQVKIDGNHPLAGETLHFDVTVRDVRDATEEELAHGHVHGPGGHQH
ncbi:MAG: peptidylprolyl isomerase [Spirochaetaceae bacterium]|nr:peptidylprolyl isomerase [Spirochaetaceae bacterium]|tara:strand:- start:286534 stop:287016 length:483 start_codon:yes stop_codon:yes gene_type:complete